MSRRLPAIGLPSPTLLVGLCMVPFLPATFLSAVPACCSGRRRTRGRHPSHQTAMGRRSYRRSVRSLTADMSGADAQSPRAPALPARQSPAPPSRAGNLSNDSALLARPASRPIALGQILPRRARAQLPQDPVDHLPMITPPARRRPAAGAPGWPPPPRPVTWTGLADSPQTPRPPARTITDAGDQAQALTGPAATIA